MKKVFSIIIFLLAIVGIGLLTSYTLTHRGERKMVKPVVNKQPEKISSNMTENHLIEIYSIYLNDQKYKLKYEYIVSFSTETGYASGDFNLYLNGKSILKEKVIEDAIAVNIKDLFNLEDIKNNVRLDVDDFNIFRVKDNDYVLFKVSYYLNKNIEEKYFLFNKEGELLISDLLGYDSKVVYESQDKDEFYYDDKRLVKFENNTLYSLEYNDGILTEYKYEISDNKINKVIINTYDDIKIVK